MTWIEVARGPFERLLEAEAETGRDAVRSRLEGLRLAYMDLRAEGADRPLAEGPEAARTKGPWVLWMLRKMLSPIAFQPLLSTWRAGDALETASLQKALERLADADLGSFFDFWVYGTHLVEYRLQRAQARSRGEDYALALQVKNSGMGAWPAPLVVQTEEGARHQFSVQAPAGGAAELQVDLVTKPISAAVNPDGDMLSADGPGPWMPVSIRKFWFF